MDYVINKRIIHLQKDGKQLCYWNGKYHWRMRIATDEEVAKYHLCGTCQKASRKFDDAPEVPVKVALTRDDLNNIQEALEFLITSEFCPLYRIDELEVTLNKLK